MIRLCIKHYSQTFLLCFFLSLSYLPLIAQNSQALIDSLEQVLTTSSSDSVKLRIHDQLRRKYVRLNLEKAEFHGNKFIETARRLDMTGSISGGKITLAQVQFYKGDYPSAIQNFLSAEPYFSESNDSLKLGSIYNGLAACYQDSNDSIALSYYQKSFDLFENINDKKAALALTNISNVYADNQEFHKAIPLLRRSIKMLDPVKHDYYFYIANLNLANSLSETSEYKEAENIYQRILDYYKDQKDLDLYAYAIGGLGYTQSKQGKHTIAIKNLNEAIAIGEKIGFREDRLTKLIDLSNAYKQTNNYKGAFTALSKYQVLSDSFFTEDKETILAEAIQKFEGEKKDQEIALLNTQNELTELKYQQSNRSRIFFIALSIGLILFVGLLYRLVQLRRKANEKLTQKNQQIKSALNDKEMLLKEIHHRVKNNLQIISSLLSIQSRQINDPQAQEAMQESRNRVRSMALIHQNLYQDEQLVGVNTKEYIEKLADSLIQNYKIGDIDIQIETDIEEVKLDVETIIPLGLIINELISNALKYAFENNKSGKILLSLKQENEALLFCVADNGVGIPSSFSIQESDSLGFRLIQAFSTKLGAELNIDGQSDGTNITMRIPDFKAA